MFPQSPLVSHMCREFPCRRQLGPSVLNSFSNPSSLCHLCTVYNIHFMPIKSVDHIIKLYSLYIDRETDSNWQLKRFHYNNPYFSHKPLTHFFIHLSLCKPIILNNSLYIILFVSIKESETVGPFTSCENELPSTCSSPENKTLSWKKTTVLLSCKQLLVLTE